MISNDIESLLPQTDGFPLGKGVELIRGKTLAKTGSWFKAIILVKVGEKKQLRFYGWQKNKEGEYKVRQKFNVSKGYSALVGEIMYAFDEMDK